MFFADWLWSVTAPAVGLKTISDLLDTNINHTGILYAISSHHTYVTTWAMYAIYGTLQEAAKITDEYNKFSLHEKWNNGLHHYRTVNA